MSERKALKIESGPGSDPVEERKEKRLNVW